LRAEGRSDSAPIASNSTKEGRATNRRIEIVLMREELN
jgi:type VI secretion system protein ImpK